LVIRCASCQIQWVSIAVMAPGGGGHVGEHRQRHLEVVVGVGTPRQPPHVAQLRDAHRAGHRPEVRVGKRDVEGVGANSLAMPV
jgi:hypothetical protein